jgi:hypothetical protein
MADPQTVDITTGVSTLKAFNISNVTGSAYQHARDGVLLGWGLRNSVGVAEDPVSGAIYSVENSVDNIQRSGQTINQNNPGEELNFHGYLNGTRSLVTGGNYGYPSCFAAWNVTEIPENDGLQTGYNFAIGKKIPGYEVGGLLQCDGPTTSCVEAGQLLVTYSSPNLANSF